MSWNYRVVKRKYETYDYYGMYEVYYDTSGNVVGMSADPIAASGFTIDDVVEDIQLMKDGLAKDIINYEDIVEGIQLMKDRLAKGIPNYEDTVHEVFDGTT